MKLQSTMNQNTKRIWFLSFLRQKTAVMFEVIHGLPVQVGHRETIGDITGHSFFPLPVGIRPFNRTDQSRRQTTSDDDTQHPLRKSVSRNACF